MKVYANLSPFAAASERAGQWKNGGELVEFAPDQVRVEYGKAPRTWQEPTEVDHCADWLIALLESEGGPLKPKVICEEASEAGFSRTTVYKARRILAGRIENTKGARSPANEWVLVGE